MPRGALLSSEFSFITSLTSFCDLLFSELLGRSTGLGLFKQERRVYRRKGRRVFCLLRPEPPGNTIGSQMKCFLASSNRRCSMTALIFRRTALSKLHVSKTRIYRCATIGELHAQAIVVYAESKAPPDDACERVFQLCSYWSIDAGFAPPHLDDVARNRSLTATSHLTNSWYQRMLRFCYTIASVDLSPS